jgi:hypothetical protein
MDADVLLSASGDVMSHIDRTGRRWTSISDLKETSRWTKFGAVEKSLEKMFEALVKKYLKRGEFQQSATSFQLWSMAKRKVDNKTLGLIIKDYMDGMEKVIKKNINIFSDAMLSYAKKRSTDLSWDEQVVNNIKVKTAHFFKLPISIAQTDDQIEMSEKQQELIAFAESKGWSTKIWDAAIELEAYTRTVAKKELGK